MRTTSTLLTMTAALLMSTTQSAYQAYGTWYWSIYEPYGACGEAEWSLGKMPYVALNV